MKILSKIGDAIVAAKDNIDPDTAATLIVTAVLISAMAFDTPWPACLGLWIVAVAVIAIPMILAIVHDDGLF